MNDSNTPPGKTTESVEPDAGQPLDRSDHVDHLRSLVIMAMADGQLSETEAELIYQRCGQLRLSDGDFLVAMKSGLCDDAMITLPESEGDRERLVGDLIATMAVDGQIHEREKRLLVFTAARLRLPASRLAELVAVGVSERDPSPSRDGDGDGIGSERCG